MEVSSSFVTMTEGIRRKEKKKRGGGKKESVGGAQPVREFLRERGKKQDGKTFVRSGGQEKKGGKKEGGRLQK